jgi:predicted nucleic acid-binding protein
MNVMSDKIFVDSNVWLYLFLQDDGKKYKIAEKYFKENGLKSTFIITYQVINEVSNILLKNDYTESKIKENIDHMFKVSTIQDFTKEIILSASSARETYSFSFWDSILIGSALFSECNMFISEDMQDGLMVNNKLLIKNTFK